MKLRFKGKFDGDESKLPAKEHIPGAVMFKEPEQSKFALIANGLSLFVIVVLIAIELFITGNSIYSVGRGVFEGCFLSMLVLVPHEFLHAICFREEVFMYIMPSKMLLFVCGTESMSKARFVFMSLLPNIVFGLIPYILFLIVPKWTILGYFGAFSLGSGCGDYINVFNAITQMPRGAKTYLNGFHSYWYLED
ncbi:MAG: DUF3267 domain-containing protein [Eubacterium sp.]|nr:DUF3267 domain-containing protein [Eubacterium sp.]